MNFVNVQIILTSYSKISNGCNLFLSIKKASKSHSHQGPTLQGTVGHAVIICSSPYLFSRLFTFLSADVVPCPPAATYVVVRVRHVRATIYFHIFLSQSFANDMLCDGLLSLKGNEKPVEMT